jgi:hypothetical protein
MQQNSHDSTTTHDTSYSDGTRSHLLTIDGGEAGDFEYARIMTSQGEQPSEEEIQADLEQFAPRPFSMWR